MNILIIHPDFQGLGGVANYYKQLQGKFNIPVQHFIVGKRPKEKYFLSRIFRMFADYWRFAKCLKKSNIDLVHLNPSLDPKSFIRDGTFALLARVYKKKIVVFFHGWQKSFERHIERYFLWMFRLLFGNSDAFIVLSEEFKRVLEKWGVVQAIYKEVTVIDEDELAEFDIHDSLEKRQSSEKWRILFLSRILKEKGIYETVEAVSLLQPKYPMIELIVAGDGNELENVKSFVCDRNISNVSFIGYVRGKEKRQVFEESNIFCFPSYHEGMPCSVVEAIAFGLPVVTRPVGGLRDFFKNGEHGFISDSLSPNVFANLIERLLANENLYKKISLNNYQYAQSHFLASGAALRLETIYRTALGNQRYKNKE